MCLVSVVHDPESISSRICVLIRKNLVSHDIDISFDFRLLKLTILNIIISLLGKPTHRSISTLQDVQIRAFKNEVSGLP